MLEIPQVMHGPIRLIAIVRITMPRAEIRNVLGPGLDDIKWVGQR